MKKPIHILIVEDMAADADLATRTIRKVLKDCEFQVVETRKDFLKALEVFQPDVILSDYSLPRFDGMTGLEAGAETCAIHPAHHLDRLDQRRCGSGLHESGCQ